VLGILHTITGGSDQQIGFMRYAARRGWRSCVLNRRGHSGMPLRVPNFSILGNIDDTCAMVKNIRAAHPRSFIGLAGISAGSGQVVSYIGREGDAAPVDAAASLCPAWDITQSFDYVQARYPFMDSYITKGIQKFFLLRPENREALAQLPQAVDAALEAKNLNDFVKAATPLAGCSDLSQYYAENNPMAHAFNNTTPCLVLNALDDFLCVKENIRLDIVESTQHYAVLVTDSGSHIAYTEGSLGEGSYMWRLTMDFFEAVKLQS